MTFFLDGSFVYLGYCLLDVIFSLVLIPLFLEKLNKKVSRKILAAWNIKNFLVYVYMLISLLEGRGFILANITPDKKQLFLKYTHLPLLIKFCGFYIRPSCKLTTALELAKILTNYSFLIRLFSEGSILQISKDLCNYSITKETLEYVQDFSINTVEKSLALISLAQGYQIWFFFALVIGVTLYTLYTAYMTVVSLEYQL